MAHIVWTIQAVCLMGLGVLSGCANTIPASTALPRLATSQDQATIQVLHTRLHERERTIARQSYQMEILSSQLEALKRIDQDTRAPRLPVRNSVTIAP